MQHKLHYHFKPAINADGGGLNVFQPCQSQQQQQVHPLPQSNPISFHSINTVATTLSLDRYIQLIFHLTRGCDSTGWTVKHRDATGLKMDEIKQLLALHGYSTKGCRTKQEVLNMMQGMVLIMPFQASPPLQAASSPFRQQHVIEGLRKALHRIIPARAEEISDIVSQYGYFSPSSLLLYQQFQHPQNFFPTIAITIPPNSQSKAHSAPKMARKPRIFQHPVNNSESRSIITSHAYNTIKLKDANGYLQQNIIKPPAWLLRDVENLSLSCQGCSDSCTNPQDLIGKKVALVIVHELETQQQAEDEYIDVLQVGIHVAQVIRWIGDFHDEMVCSPCCTCSHSFYGVRLSPSHTMHETETKRVVVNGRQKNRRRLELEVDLHEKYRESNLEDLLSLWNDDGDGCDGICGQMKRLSDAWVLLDPREDN